MKVFVGQLMIFSGSFYLGSITETGSELALVVLSILGIIVGVLLRHDPNFMR